jgi:hypothetical protein
MSYMRGEQYLWSDGDRLHIWIAGGYDGWDEAGWACDADGKRSAERKNASGVSIPISTADEFVVLRLAELIAEGKLEDTIDRAAARHRGNFGCTALSRNAEALKVALRGVRIQGPDKPA